jgi:hypothetical protein
MRLYYMRLFFSMVPCFSSIVKLNSGYAHNMCIAVKVRLSIVQSFSRRNRFSRDVLGTEKVP